MLNQYKNYILHVKHNFYFCKLQYAAMAKLVDALL